MPTIGGGPLANLSCLVGRFIYPSVSSPTITASINSNLDYYTYNLDFRPRPAVLPMPALPASWIRMSITTPAWPTTAVWLVPLSSGFASRRSARWRDNGQTRVWNLLIDVIAQTGRYPASATALSQFEVDGEKRIWLHVAIDRYTGQILDKQVEVVAQ